MSGLPQGLCAMASAATGTPATPAMQPPPLLEAMLAQADLSSFLHCRSVCRLVPHQQPEVSLYQLSVSIADLGDVLLPGLDLAGQGSLKTRLAACTEQRLLSMIERSIGSEFPSVILLPLQLTTLLSEAFLSFDRRLPMARRGTIVIAIEAAEIFDNLTDWMIARSFLAARGYSIGFISAWPGIASLLHWRRLGADWIKVPFSDDDAVIHAFANGGDRHGVILGDTDTPRALELGQAAGIRYFEGRYIDQLTRACGGHGKKIGGIPLPFPAMPS